MDTLCINNITVYSGIKPPKGIIMNEIDCENIKFWITKCKNFYYVSDSKHPISTYGATTSNYLVCHLFYIIKDVIIPKLKNPIEIELTNNFMYGCMEYLRTYSLNSYNESLEDPIITKFFCENFVPVYANPLSLSYFNCKVKNMKFKQHTLKNNITKMFDNFSKEFDSMSKVLMEKIKPEPIEKIAKVDKEVQTSVITENVWKNKTILKKTVETQTIPVKMNSKAIQSNIEKETCSIDIQVDILIEKVPEVIIEKKKKKKNEELITFTENEYAKMMQAHKEDVEKARKEGLDKYKGKFTNYVSDSMLSVKELCNILSSTNSVTVAESLVMYFLILINKHFSLRVKQLPGGKCKKRKFYEFWHTIVLPNILKQSTHPVFILLREEWECFCGIVARSGINVLNHHFDVLFDHYSSVILSNCWDLQDYVPTFYLLLFRRCRNIPLLIGLISIFDEKIKKGISTEEKIEMYKSFEVLYTTPSEREILFKYKDKIIEEDQTMRIFYDLDDLTGVTISELLV